MNTPRSERHPRASSHELLGDHPFVFEDRTDPAVRARRAEAELLRRWVEAEREAGRLPS